VILLRYGAFAQYLQVTPDTLAIPIPHASPEYFGVGVSGQTAAVSLQYHARVAPGEVVLVTAAAGGTGQIAVQWAKVLGAHVIGVCSNKNGKVELLRKLGADRVIDYTAEDVDSVLKQEYPRGLDVVFESVGGKMFDTCFNKYRFS
jgi:prostaglandin reductase 3